MNMTPKSLAKQVSSLKATTLVIKATFACCEFLIETDDCCSVSGFSPDAEVRPVEQPDSLQGKTFHHLWSLCSTEKHWCFNSNCSWVYASGRQQVTFTLRKLIDSVMLNGIFPQTENHPSYLERSSSYLRSYKRHLHFLHYIVYCLVAEKMIKIICFPIWSCEVKWFNSSILGPTLL